MLLFRLSIVSKKKQSVCKPGSVLLFLKKPNHPFFIKEVSVIYLSRMSPYKL